MAQDLKGRDVLTPPEIKILVMSLAGTIEDFEAVGKDPRLPWTPEARKDMKEMLTHAYSAKKKLEKTTGFEVRLDPYVEGDEKDMLTKES